MRLPTARQPSVDENENGFHLTGACTRVQRFRDSGSADPLWQPIGNYDDWFRIRNHNSGCCWW